MGASRIFKRNQIQKLTGSRSTAYSGALRNMVEADEFNRKERKDKKKIGYKQFNMRKRLGLALREIKGDL